MRWSWCIYLLVCTPFFNVKLIPRRGVGDETLFGWDKGLGNQQLLEITNFMTFFSKLVNIVSCDWTPLFWFGHHFYYINLTTRRGVGT